MKKPVGIVILNWNGRSLLERFLPYLLRHTDPQQADVIVADNGSTDDSLAWLQEYHPDVEQIRLDRNYGFAGGYNRALESLDYEYVVLLNSDVMVTPGWLTKAVDYLDAHPDVVALQPKILDYKDQSKFEYAGACGGFLDIYGYPFCRGRVFGVIEEDRKQYDDVTDILWASGACLFIRLEAYRAIGGLDEYFFAHQEEVDLCWRLRARGKRIVSFPPSVVYHVGGATLAKENPQKTYLNFRNNLLMLHKNLPEAYYHQVMRARWWLDRLAVVQFVLKLHFRDAAAVLRARGDFRREKKNYQTLREENLRLSQTELPAEIYTRCLLWQFYVNNKKKYKQLIQ